MVEIMVNSSSLAAQFSRRFTVIGHDFQRFIMGDIGWCSISRKLISSRYSSNEWGEMIIPHFPHQEAPVFAASSGWVASWQLSRGRCIFFLFIVWTSWCTMVEWCWMHGCQFYKAHICSRDYPPGNYLLKVSMVIVNPKTRTVGKLT